MDYTKCPHPKRITRLALLGILALFLIVSVVWISGYGKSTESGQGIVGDAPGMAWIGKQAEPFTLPGIDGKPVNIATDLGKRPIVLVFYRGVW